MSRSSSPPKNSSLDENQNSDSLNSKGSGQLSSPKLKEDIGSDDTLDIDLTPLERSERIYSLKSSEETIDFEEYQRHNDTLDPDCKKDISPDKASKKSAQDRRDLHLVSGERFGVYEILHRIGSGGMGSVYAAFNHQLKRRVALKVIQKDSAVSSTQNLLQEAQSIAQLEHPHIVTVYNVGEEGGLFYIEMQLILGQPLNHVLRDQDLPTERIIRLLTELASALDHAHERGVIHRDIKAENVLVSDDGSARLVDFGLSQIDQESLKKMRAFNGLDSDDSEQPIADQSKYSRSGTPAYMAPEFWLKGEAGVSTDLYAFGVMAYLMYEGNLPFKGSSWHEVMEAHLDHHPEPLSEQSASSQLSRLIMDCIERDPENRPSGTREVLKRLQTAQDEYASHMDHPIEPSSSFLMKWPQLSLRFLFSLISLILITVGCLHVSLWERLDHNTLDFMQFLQPEPENTPVGLIKIDEVAAINKGKYFNRKAFSSVIKNTLNDGAQSVGVDLVMDLSESLLSDMYWESLVYDERVIQSVALLNMTDEQDSLMDVNHGKHIYEPAKKTSSLTPKSVDEDRELKEIDLQHTLPIENGEIDGEENAPMFIKPIPDFLKGGHVLGHIQLSRDPDGVTRRIPMLIKAHGRFYPALSLLLAAQTLGAKADHIQYKNGKLSIHPPQGERISIPVDDEGRLLLRVRGDANQRPSKSIVALLTSSEDLPSKVGQASALILGVSTPSEGDYGPLSYWRYTPLSYAHIIAAENIINRDFLQSASPRVSLALTLILVLLTFWLTSLARGALSLVSVILCQVVAVGVALSALVLLDIALPLASLSIHIGLANLWALVYRALHERKLRVDLTHRLGQALPPSVAQRLISESVRKTQPQYNATRVSLVLCSLRLANLDELSEELEPTNFAKVLRQLAQRIRKLTLDFGGVLTSSQRGGVLITFHPTKEEEGEEEVTLRSALFAIAIHQLAHEEEWRWRALKVKPPRLNISLHWGDLISGPMSLHYKETYTIYGEVVQCAELLSQNTYDGTLISESFIKVCSPKIQTTPGPTITVKDQLMKTRYFNEIREADGSTLLDKGSIKT
jgi:serine/threonine protein kinase/class 3 adenylate cyclase